ncbi:MAG: hypothetical protein HEQ21_07635 [Blastomonas sp.]|uniref:hypothetical protein n=1 Tax=Blastomonas sp. TaxID=1909299 RepID=UPI00258B4823|nr:hypothetical protein [Blastomonas sp.]MCO5792675.1 hypothetical protein [Blastomonas sp.]
MISFNIPVLVADVSPPPQLAERRKKARYGNILRKLRKNGISGLKFASLLSPQNRAGVVASNFFFAGSEVHHVAA